MKNIVNEKYNELTYYTLELKDKCFIHQYVVDAFTLQTANNETKAISLTFSLVGLYLYIEKNYTGKEVQKFHTLMSNKKIEWPFFILPTNRGEISIDNVLEANSSEERNNLIKIWSISVWKAFNESHSAVREIADYYLNIKNETTNR
jgi:Family of unknown function (DUF5946)